MLIIFNGSDLDQVLLIVVRHDAKWANRMQPFIAAETVKNWIRFGDLSLTNPKYYLTFDNFTEKLFTRANKNTK
jgi:hypothetical protein